ncbi:MAG TPA: LytR C-terminal domain-containing protein [Ilumatobacteraceae bacterium]|nr:LytR C-terminal domain-containing protein [Ilumatobacteraceae bacterium]
MSNEDPDAPVTPTPSRRSPRQGVGGSPMGSTISIVLAVVAVIVGFLILNNITDDGPSDSGGTTVDSVVGSTPDSIVENTTTTTTEPPFVTEGATVVVANASGVPGSAGRMTTELATVGFTMVEPAINSTQSGLTASIVQYDSTIAAAKAVAESVARSMGGLTVEVVPTPAPVEGGSLNGAGVLVLLGTDEADKTVAQLSAPTAGVTPAPDPSGGTTGDTTADATGDTTG